MSPLNRYQVSEDRRQKTEDRNDSNSGQTRTDQITPSRVSVIPALSSDFCPLTSDIHVLSQVIEWLNHGDEVYLVSVLKTWGSAPREIGAWMGIRADGHVVGSVSGGCIEADLIKQVQQHALAQHTLSLQHYGITPGEAARFRLPCGGQLTVLIEKNPALEPLTQLAEALAQRQSMLRTVNLAKNTVTLRPARQNEQSTWEDPIFNAIYGPRFRLLLIGAGELSLMVAKMAQAFDYDITVCDPREEFLQEWRLPHVTLISDMPDDAVLALQADAATAVLALTHDPKLDDMALLEALNSPAFYVGALGSCQNSAKRRARLSELGLSQEAVKRLHCPIGLHLGGRSPAVIALATLAELTALRHGIPIEQHHDCH